MKLPAPYLLKGLSPAEEERPDSCASPSCTAAQAAASRGREGAAWVEDRAHEQRLGLGLSTLGWLGWDAQPAATAEQAGTLTVLLLPLPLRQG
jgi:hypothetical protein